MGRPRVKPMGLQYGPYVAHGFIMLLDRESPTGLPCGYGAGLWVT